MMLQGSSNTGAGLRLMPFPIGISIGSLSSGVIMNNTGRYYYLGIFSMFVFNVGTGLFCTFNLRTPNILQHLSLFFFGTGYGATLTVGLVSLIAAVKHSEQATTTSASYLFRSTGGTIGAAVGAAVFQSTLRNNLDKLLGGSEVARDIMERVLRDFGEVLKVEAPWKELVVDAYMGALRMVFIAAFVLG
jgi:MFS family permease